MRDPAGRSRAWRWLSLLLVVLVALSACSGRDDVSDAPAALIDAAPAGTVLMGAYAPSGVWHGLAPLRALEARVGRHFDVAHWFTSWNFDFDPVPVHDVLSTGRIPLISWQPTDLPVTAIAAGDHDDYVRSWARGVADAPGLVYIRPFPEMNGEWVSWNGDPATFRRAWRRVAGIFTAEGASNVRWVFGPNVTDEPRSEANRMEHYYPGHDVVDVLALSGFNWGETRPDIGWRSFEQVFERGYARLTELGPQPVWLAEIASSELGGDKAAWVRDMFASTTFARLQAIIWFDEDKEADWRVTSSPEVVAAFREALAPPTEALAQR